MNNLGGALSYFANQQNGSFSDPFSQSPDEPMISSSQIKSIIDDVDSRRYEEKKKKKKHGKVDKILQKGSSLIDRFASEEVIDEFDDFIANYMFEDEDVTLKNNLISLGRKYARDTKVSGETSEITKAYSSSEKILNNILLEIEKDKEDVQKDITSMRLSRSKNYKALTELSEVKAQYHNIALNVVKELNSMKKAQFELQLKNDKNKASESDNTEMASNRAIQNLFGLGRGTMINAIGGYTSVSGAIDDDTASARMSDDYSVDEDELIQRKYFSEDVEESDGDKFLKYENRGVEYVLLIDENGHKDVIAEDKDGNIVPDYPMPTDIDSLTFSISEITQTATDNYNRSYKLRRLSE